MTQPDLLFIVTDHQAWHGHFANPDGSPGGIAPVRLPVWERFCDEGVRFRQAYASCPLCTPARSSMMSGLTAVQHGMRQNCDGGGDFTPRTELYSHHLARAGYRNAYVGKWHCGHERIPIDYGIEGWSLPDYGKVYMSERYAAYCEQRGFGPARARIEFSFRPEHIGTTQTLHHRSPWHFMNASGVLEGPREAHEEDFVAHLACEKLTELSERDQPFSLVASFWGPHQAYYPTEPFAGQVDPRSIPEHPSYRDDLSDKPLRHHLHRRVHHPGVAALASWSDWQPVLARCYEQSLQTDAAVGQVLEALARSGRAENTLVIWLADHGDAVGARGGLWDKGATMPEEVMRVPMAMRWPAGLGAGRAIDDPISHLDCPATLLEAAGCAVPTHWASRSLLPVARGDERRKRVVCAHHGHAGTTLEQRMLRRGRWKYIAALYDGDELYDLEADPWELDNRIDDPECADVIADCRAMLREHLAGEPQDAMVQRLGVALSV